jgi:putative membrane protein
MLVRRWLREDALTRRGTRATWSHGRTLVFLLSVAVLELGLFPRWLPYAEGDFRKHMLQHLLLAMLAPVGFVMGAPITLLLRVAPPAHRRRVIRAMRSPMVRSVANPIVALTLNLGGMAALYFTPLYMQMMMHPTLHCLVHLHFVAAGCFYAWVIAGPDPAPFRPSVPARLAVLGLYAGMFVAVPASRAELQAGAVLMFYGGDITEMLLAVALVTTVAASTGCRAECTVTSSRNLPITGQ